MAPADKGSFRFDPASIVDCRNRLGLTQADLARLIGVPANTLSRWETGRAAPDAHSLAAVYSVAQDRGLSMNFFRRVEIQPRNRLVVVLDFQNLGITARDISKMDDFLMEKLDRIAPQTELEVFKAFARPDQEAAISELKKLKWRVKADKVNLDSAIVQQVKSDCGHDPENTVLVICSRDGDFASLVREMQDWGVEVYLMGPADTSQRLIHAVERDHRIHWPDPHPDVVQAVSITGLNAGQL